MTEGETGNGGNVFEREHHHQPVRQLTSVNKPDLVS